MTDFNGRVAIVTGAGNGLGRSHAMGLAKGGARVVVSDISQAAAEQVVEEIRSLGGQAIASAADVANIDQVKALVERVGKEWGGVDILVNNAGILRDKSFGKLEPGDFELVIKVHLIGSYNCTKAVWDQMRERNYGRIVFTSSASGIYGNFGQTNYGAAKAAMVGMMNCLHLEGAKYNIRVNTLAPTAATQMTAGLIPDEAAALLSPETVTPAVLYLVSENAPSRMIMGAGAGVFAVTQISESEGVFLPESERTVEGIARHIEAIASQANAQPIVNAFDQTRKFVDIAARALAAGKN
ncbi:SDR family NAD(P)-dependent oxidoreductase [Rhizobium alvei]|uniref:SDR family NAD(P)-dependent oxidoreductase n=1 Tax=Rhizobium alvei TaxID=1132659 RepID=A0ABT8YSY8_9HYPH|nr:SDR family NAD(P)-dependent oxidoreductase [Rhizobium alvei]MDO6966828.1 SDR family NAD(P)-dependent oxidoreductase [Rhizobium alvei]